MLVKRIVIGSPLYRDALLIAERGRHRGIVSGSIQERESREIGLARHHVTLSGNHGAPKRWIEIAALSNLPGERFVDVAVFVFHVEAIGYRYLHFVRV